MLTIIQTLHLEGTQGGPSLLWPPRLPRQTLPCDFNVSHMLVCSAQYRRHAAISGWIDSSVHNWICKNVSSGGRVSCRSLLGVPRGWRFAEWLQHARYKRTWTGRSPTNIFHVTFFNERTAESVSSFGVLHLVWHHGFRGGICRVSVLTVFVYAL